MENCLLGQLSKVQFDGREAGKAFCSSRRRRTERPYYPACCFTLHTSQLFEYAFVLGALEIPQSVPVCCDQQNAGPIPNVPGELWTLQFIQGNSIHWQPVRTCKPGSPFARSAGSTSLRPPPNSSGGYNTVPTGMPAASLLFLQDRDRRPHWTTLIRVGQIQLSMLGPGWLEIVSTSGVN